MESANNFSYIFLDMFGVITYGAWWRIARVDAFRPESRGFESCSGRHVGTLGKSFTYSFL